jgi:predicted nuclease of predicted toxin-antitoxin system
MIRILLDQGLAPRAAALLRQRGFETIHVSEIGMAEAEDIEILAAAALSGWICVTLDHDFHTHLAIAGHGRPSVILLRAEGLSAEAQADLITTVCERCRAALEDGAAVSADGHSIRVRRLPLR